MGKVERIDFEPITQAPLTVRIREACRLTGIGRSKLYELIAEGEIDVMKVGAITLIPMRALEQFLDACERPASRP